MNISLDNFNRLSVDERKFVLKYGADNCSLVKFKNRFADILFASYGKDSYDDNDIAMFKSISDGKWHIVYSYDNDDYFLAGDDNIVFFDACFSETSDDFSLYLRQR